MGLNAAQSVGSGSVCMSDRFSSICISVYINLSHDSPSKQEEAMELKQEVTQLELSGDKPSAVKRECQSVVKSETDVSCVCIWW